jgi:YidC/Oxa1 family membrane protein insertase
MQKMMIYFMPIFIGVITYGFPSGLMLYWLVSTVWQVLQQFWVRKHLHKPAESTPPPSAKEAGAKG